MKCTLASKEGRCGKLNYKCTRCGFEESVIKERKEAIAKGLMKVNKDGKEYLPVKVTFESIINNT